MTKREAINLFGNRHKDLAEALGVTEGRISQLPDELKPEQVDRVLGAALRLGRLRLVPEAVAKEAA